MNERHEIRVSIEIDKTAARIWERVSDHEHTGTWVEAVKEVTLLRPGTPSNGLGAIRIVRFKPLHWFYEEITYFDAPHAFHYVLFKGMPGLASHLGKVIVDDLGDDRSRLRWEVDFVFKPYHPFRLLVPAFLREFEGVLKAGLESLKAQLESVEEQQNRAADST